MGEAARTRGAARLRDQGNDHARVMRAGFGIRLNKEPPNIGFRRKDKGGINLTSTVPTTKLDLEMVKSILSVYKIHNADVTLRYDASEDDLIDVIEGNRIYIPACTC